MFWFKVIYSLMFVLKIMFNKKIDFQPKNMKFQQQKCKSIF